MLIFTVFGLLLPLILLVMATALACFFAGRPRAGAFFVFVAVNFFRPFAFFLSQIAYTNPHDSFTYSILTSDLGNTLVWGGCLFCLVWAWRDQYRNMGGIRGLKQSVSTTRQTFQPDRNKNKRKLTQ